MSVLRFEVPGTPAPQGSKRHVGDGRMVESSKDLPAWRDSLTIAARQAAVKHRVLFDEPVCVEVTFRCPMPRSRKKAVRDAGIGPKSTAPDLDKLQRALGDALEAGGLLTNDAVIARWVAEKVEVTGWTGAAIRITPLSKEEA